MINKSHAQKYLFIDVETVSGQPDFKTLQEEDPKLALLWEKRHRYYSGNYSEYYESDPSVTYKDKAGLEPEFCRIVCVSFGTYHPDYEGGKRLMSLHGDESDILEKTKKVMHNSHATGYSLCGHNIKAFDVPCVGKRMLYNGMMPPSMINVVNKKPWEITFVDTSELFSFGSWTNQKSLSLDLLTHSLGIQSPKSIMDGSQVSEFFYNGRISDIVTYCEADVRAVMEVVETVSV